LDELDTQAVPPGHDARLRQLVNKGLLDGAR
jgi:hypothetical protein